MRVLHVSSARSWRGGEQQVLLLMEGLRRAGVDQVLIAPGGSPLAMRAAAADFVVETMPIRNEGDVRALCGILARTRREAFDLLHLHTSQAHGLGALAVRLRGRRRPAIVVTRRVEHSIYRHSFLRLDRVKYAPGADRVLCVSERVHDVLLADGVPAAMLAVVPDGVDVARFASPAVSRDAVRDALGIPEDARLVGTVGHLDVGKGHRTLLAALARAHRDDPLIWGLVVGEGPERERLAAEAAGLGLAERVVFTGFRDDVPDLLHALDVFAFPSLHEGLGSAALEAMAAGVPVVVARAGGLEEVVRDGLDGLVVPVDDPRALSAAIAVTLRDLTATRARVASARSRVQTHYSTENMVAGTLREYARVSGALPRASSATL